MPYGQDIPDVSQVVIETIQEDDSIIKVHEASQPLEVVHENIHGSQKGR